MDWSIAAILAQDGITSGAVYALLALALVLVFSVTRVIFIAQGEFVAYAALTLANLQAGQFPHSAVLLAGLGAAAFAQQVLQWRRRMAPADRRAVVIALFKFIVLPLGLLVLSRSLPLADLPLVLQLALTLALVVPVAPLLYRLAFAPLAEASSLVLLIVSVGVHFALLGSGLLMFGAEGARTRAFSEARINLGVLQISGQSLVIVLVSAVLVVALYLYFEATLPGKALRATAINRRGAQLVGIGTTGAGRLAFTLAGALGALCGILIAPVTTIYYDSGFLIGLKGFVGAIIGALASYPLAAAGALLVGLLEAFASFWASAYKEVIVFTLIIPVLLWRSLLHPATDEGEQ